MREPDPGGLRFVDLRSRLCFDVIHLRIAVDEFGSERQIAICIDQAGSNMLHGNRTPAVRRPVRIQRDMDTEVGIGVALRPLCYFRKPWARDHDARRRYPAFL